ncbi:MAG TPA: hypothetical protein PLN63_01220 [Paludibacteraceae bacterium]|nr:hypothetical protein [Paludibacteraceae bacterium]HOU68101.1 hypothetical protein [Paludibacteraceae bacterium]HPH62232.1 hypothetical protein [Paludibacteraceae bacterium]HQF50007.1 hypothetical protein [Paludibacteraceae bacterium]HQJ89919.1 hypothetical protein [Paludibacteraceae bacterium]
MKNIKSLLFALLLGTGAVQGQDDSISAKLPETEGFGLLMEHPEKFKAENNRNLYLGVYCNTFTRNAEYFLPYTKGYTALGFFLDPTLSYQINDKAAITAGAHLAGIAGDDEGIRKAWPIVRIEYQPTNWLTVVGGTLYGNLSHKLYEPMYDFDRYLYANQENGLQVFTDTKYWESDLWCNWEVFIVPDDAKQERFTFGWVNRFFLIGNKQNRKTFELSVPVHILATHRGGQFTSLQDTCIETLANGMVGLTSSINSPNLFIKKTTLDLDVFGFKNNSGVIGTHYKSGWGIYPNLTLQSKKIKFQAGYWKAKKFVAPRGSYLFQSIAYFDNAFEQADRNMVTGKLFYEHQYKGLGFGAEAQAYYDLDHEKTDFSFGIYLTLNNKFKLMKVNEDMTF